MTTRVIQPIFDPSPRIRPIRSTRNRKSVSRQLFGPVDHDATRRFFEAELKKDQRLASNAWDFDFDKGEPRKDPGRRYEWEKASVTLAPRRPTLPKPEPDITELYATLPIRAQHEENQAEIENGEQKQDVQKKDDKKLNSKQTQISDYMRIRKRSSESISAKKVTESVIPPTKISKYNC
ncbi:hypothetical protein AMK59_543 [Oryctes borbonicus]|uniref:Cyclin-dependent kinase inhibitor domain-containing protein n=1 Tax=Oryctes borbonicus TaxID=1629725 RepID=A0A0T6BCB6_9SCAR|nr:hypothetical protein AMK59_543 [Oryctes borbonicus]